MSYQCKQKADKPAFSFADDESGHPPKSVALIDLKNKGIGPIDTVIFSVRLDTVLASEGREIFDQKCTACHRLDAKFIGPPLSHVLNRRSPEWVMNMILNPEGMLAGDSLAQALFMEYKGQVMTQQHLSEQEARAVLEYLRGVD